MLTTIVGVLELCTEILPTFVMWELDLQKGGYMHVWILHNLESKKMTQYTSQRVFLYGFEAPVYSIMLHITNTSFIVPEIVVTGTAGITETSVATATGTQLTTAAATSSSTTSTSTTSTTGIGSTSTSTSTSSSSTSTSSSSTSTSTSSSTTGTTAVASTGAVTSTTSGAGVSTTGEGSSVEITSTTGSPSAPIDQGNHLITISALTIIQEMMKITQLL
jgi:hypothetical protein